jgi:hypothetical protein
MTLSIKDLDGTWRVTTITDTKGPVPLQSDGETTVSNGRTDRTDKKGCRWMSQMTVLSDDSVRFDSVADPTDADADFCLMTEGNQPTREPVEYSCVLKVARQGDKMRLSGQIAHGQAQTVITMTKL